MPDNVKQEAKKIGINVNRQLMKDADELEKRHKSAVEYNVLKKSANKEREDFMNSYYFNESKNTSDSKSSSVKKIDNLKNTSDKKKDSSSKKQNQKMKQDLDILLMGQDVSNDRECIKDEKNNSMQNIK